MIQVQNLTHRYGDRIALSNISFEVKKGEVFGLLGPNGGGKSTLFRILSTMMVPTDGRAVIAGHDVERDPAADVAATSALSSRPKASIRP